MPHVSPLRHGICSNVKKCHPDRRSPTQPQWRACPERACRTGRITWLFLMLIILLTNGMSSFGLKVLTSWGVPHSAKFPYLTVWYAAGFVLIAIPMLLKGARGGLKEAGWGALIAALSIGGQLAMASALGSGLSGSIVFPVTIGGSILVSSCVS